MADGAVKLLATHRRSLLLVERYHTRSARLRSRIIYSSGLRGKERDRCRHHHRGTLERPCQRQDRDCARTQQFNQLVELQNQETSGYYPPAKDIRTEQKQRKHHEERRSKRIFGSSAAVRAKSTSRPRAQPNRSSG